MLENQSFKINIRKNIPHGSGLGGGSSNAADLLNYFNSKMRLKLNKNIQARYFWKYVLKLDRAEQKLKDTISKKLIFGITKKL